MPNLRTLIEIGFCGGYGDGDYLVSSAIAELPREQFLELLQTIQFASAVAVQMWQAEQHKKQAAECKEAKP